MLADTAFSREALLEEYRTLTDRYRLLLENVERLARISDLSQRKLFRSQEEVRTRNEALYRAATTDELTAVYNRSYLLDFLRGALGRCRRDQQTLSCILIDIDDFKRVNDGWGHQSGDTVLVEVAQRIGQRVRAGDLFGRYGGEEFLVVLPSTSARSARALAEDVREQVAGRVIELPGGSIRVTVSLGITEADGSESPDGKELFNRADRALYEAKRRGKNRVVLFEVQR